MPAYPWSKSSPLLHNIEKILQAGAQTADSSIDEEKWHHQAISLSHDVSPTDVSCAAFSLLENMPYDDAIEAIKETKDGDTQEAILQVKRARKLFFIARDAIILTARPDTPIEPFAPLVATCRQLGRIADTRGKKGKKKSAAAIMELRTNLPPQPQTKSQSEFAAEVAQRLHTATILNGTTRDTNFDTFHDARKDFRRVAGFVVLGIAALNLDDQFHFANEGVALSHQHGTTKDSLQSETTRNTPLITQKI